MMSNKCRSDVCYVNYWTITTFQRKATEKKSSEKPIKTWENSIRALAKFVKGSSGEYFLWKNGISICVAGKKKITWKPSRLGGRNRVCLSTLSDDVLLKISLFITISGKYCNFFLNKTPFFVNFVPLMLETSVGISFKNKKVCGNSDRKHWEKPTSASRTRAWSVPYH